jgi:hypothetical protein
MARVCLGKYSDDRRPDRPCRNQQLKDLSLKLFHQFLKGAYMVESLCWVEYLVAQIYRTTGEKFELVRSDFLTYTHVARQKRHTKTLM